MYTNKEHIVNLSAYCIGEAEVTQELWQAVMSVNPSYFKDSDKKPVEQVSSWDWWSATTPLGGNDPHGVASGDYRVWRGGSFAFNASYCERAYRGYIEPSNSGVNLGLRLVCSP